MGSQRVLIVDDDPSVREIIAAVLRREGLIVDLAGDGQEAVRALNSREYGTVLLDLLMPLVGGEGVIAYMRSNDIRTPVIVITGHSDAHPRLDSDVVQLVMQKPIEMRDLRDVVCTVLRTV